MRSQVMFILTIRDIMPRTQQRGATAGSATLVSSAEPEPTSYYDIGQDDVVEDSELRVPGETRIDGEGSEDQEATHGEDTGSDEGPEGGEEGMFDAEERGAGTSDSNDADSESAAVQAPASESGDGSRSDSDDEIGLGQGEDKPVRVLHNFTIYDRSSRRIVPLDVLFSEHDLNKCDYGASGTVRAWVNNDDDNDDDDDDTDDEEGYQQGSDASGDGSKRIVTLSQIREVNVHDIRDRRPRSFSLDRCVVN